MKFLQYQGGFIYKSWLFGLLLAQTLWSWHTLPDVVASLLSYGGPSYGFYGLWVWWCQAIQDTFFQTWGGYALGFVIGWAYTLYVVKKVAWDVWQSTRLKHSTRKKNTPPIHGSAELASTAWMKKNNDPLGFPVGLIPSCESDDVQSLCKQLKKQKKGPVLKLKAQHAFIDAPSRAGKGRSFIVGLLLDHPGSLFVVDPKPELVHITKRAREMQGRQVYVIDPFALTSLGNTHINLLDYMVAHPEHLIEDSLFIANVLCPLNGQGAGGENQYFREAAHSIIQFLIIYLIHGQSDI